MRHAACLNRKDTPHGATEQNPIKVAVQHKHTAFIGLFYVRKVKTANFYVLKFGGLKHSL